MKARDVVGERGARAPQSELQAPDLSNAALHTTGYVHVGPLLTMAEASARLRYDGPRAAEMAVKFLRRRGAPLERRGRRWLVREANVDLALQGQGRRLDERAHVLAGRKGRHGR